MLSRIKTILFFMMLVVLFAAPAPLWAAETGAQRIEVNLPAKTITLYEGDLPVREYPVAIGKTSTPTPLGSFVVVSKEVNPAWYPPEKPGQVVPPGPSNPLGKRWLGFIANNYGIHGTNDPSSIGLAVTNGCIRMLNADVEELFELVGYNTPVKITYDLTKVFKDKSGQVKISIYPDVYGRGKPTAEPVKNALEEYGLRAFANDDYLAQILAGNGERPAVIIKTVGLKINGEAFDGQGIITRDNVYVPLKAASSALASIFSDEDSLRAGNTLNEDGQNADFILTGDRKTPVFVVNNIPYISGGDIEGLLGGRQSWQEVGNCWSFEKTLIFLNGEKTALETVKINETLAMSLKDLARVFNRGGCWDGAEQTFYLDRPDKDASVQIRPNIIGSEPFLLITKINEYFNAFVYWNIENNTIELTYP